jgi:lipopolysaccharide transport system ATP-binding protein
MSNFAIEVENLSKQYRLGERAGYKTFREAINSLAKAPFRRWNGSNSSSKIGNLRSETIWALKDVSFNVEKGEVVGIIGRNGAGKSTLLKILSKISDPTKGKVELRGRVGSLLEVGTGFHPELTGHENIYLYGAILGMDRYEITRKFGEIVTFAELEKFIETPVKRYSSGMYMRLAFAVAAHLEPEILLVDEVLAVGDLSFQKKCIGSLDEISKSGRTVLFVSHNMGAITRLCKKAIWLDDGKIISQGVSSEIVNNYQSEFLTARTEWKKQISQIKEDAPFSFLHVTVKNKDDSLTRMFSGNEPIKIDIKYTVRRYLSGCQIGVRVYNSDGIVIFYTADSDNSGVSALPKQPGNYDTSFIIPENLLAPGTYYLTIAAHLPYRNTYEVIDQAVVFEISPAESLVSLDGRMGLLTPLINWKTKKVLLS